MNNKFLKYTFLSIAAFAIVVVFANSGMADISGHVPTQAPQISLHQAIIKFLKAMGGVALSAFILYAGLTVYNKFFVHIRLDGNSEDDVLKTPHSADEALDFFIKKNKIGY